MNKFYFSFNVPMKISGASHFILVCVFFISFFSYGQTINKALPISGTSLEIPAGVTTLSSVQCWGAGGGGGGANVLSGAGGGGGGAFKSVLNFDVGLPSVDNVRIPYVVGTGGGGGTFLSTNGHNGVKTTFATVSANGGDGGGGTNLSITLGLFGKGGDGGIGGYSGGNGTTANNVLVGLGSGSGGGGAGSSG